ncbi:MAG: hypothetical protein IPL60_17760 [Ardenticatenia bacterium]|nr:hypothetical protein [Ardenticatenia bacterium]
MEQPVALLVIGLRGALGLDGAGGAAQGDGEHPVPGSARPRLMGRSTPTRTWGSTARRPTLTLFELG